MTTSTESAHTEEITKTPEVVDKSDQEQMPPPRMSTGSGKSGDIPTNKSKEADKDHPEEDGDAIKQKKVTPAVVRTRKLRHMFQSPSDAVMSPCTQGLVANAGGNPIHHPAIMKQKQKPKRLQQLND